MNTSDVHNLIDKYFDGELKKTEETILFSNLSQDEDAREYFKRHNLLKTSIQDSVEPFPDELEERIFYNIGKVSEKGFYPFFRRNVFHLTAYAATILLFIASLFFYNQKSYMGDQLKISAKQIEHQNKLINVLYNSMPTAEVNSVVDYRVIVTEEL